MWTVVRQREDSEEVAERLMATYEAQIADMQASANAPYWDGYCGLVKVCQEDLVRQDAPPQDVSQPPAPSRHAQPAGRASTAGTSTPPPGSPRSSVAGSPSPFKPGPGAVPHSRLPAADLAQQASAAMQQGRLHDAEALLHTALQRCAAADTLQATQIIDLLLDCEQALGGGAADGAPASGAQAAGGGTADSAAQRDSAGSSATALLRQAVEALAAGEERRAVRVLQKAQSACPAELPELRRRIDLYIELVLCKR